MRCSPWLALIIGMLSATVGAADHREATRLRESGEILPLEQVLKRNRPPPGSRILDVQLERRRGRYVYDIETLERGGRVDRQQYDATTGQRLRSRRKERRD